MTDKRPVIAIDGPSGSGKSTLARQLAKALGVLYIDTGAMFRALGFEMKEQGLAFESGARLDQFLAELNLIYGKEGEVYLEINGRDVTAKIREHEVSKLASIVSQLPAVRRYLLEFQRGLVRDHVCVMEGRDIGTVVFPNAFSKFFISASVDERAQRRYDQLKELAGGAPIPDFEQVRKDVLKRDESDTNRAEAPLRQAADAHFLDTSAMDLSLVLEEVIRLIKVDAAQAGITLP